MNIRPRQPLKVLLVALPVLLLCLAIFRGVVAKADVVYPNPETESAFLRGYTLANAVVPGTPLASGSSGPDRRRSRMCFPSEGIPILARNPVRK